MKNSTLQEGWLKLDRIILMIQIFLAKCENEWFCKHSWLIFIAFLSLAVTINTLLRDVDRREYNLRREQCLLYIRDQLEM